MSESEHSAQSLAPYMEDEEMDGRDDWCPECQEPAGVCACYPEPGPIPEPPSFPDRTSLIHGALRAVPCRFTLAVYAAKFARKVHRPGTDVAKTIRLALERVAGEPTRRDL